MDDKKRIRLLKMVLACSVFGQVTTLIMFAAAMKSYDKGRSEVLQSTIRRIFEVLDPTEEQLQEIQTVLEFDHGIDQLQDFLNRQK